MDETLFTIELGEGRKVRILKTEESTSVDVRLFDDNDVQTEKGQRMNLSRWKNLCESVEEVQSAVKKMKQREDVDLRIHLGGNVHVSVGSPYMCVNIRQWERITFGNKSLLPTARGVSLKFWQWEHLCQRLDEISFQLPVDLDTVVPCQLSPCHQNQLGYLKCEECNPDSYQEYQ